jgi:hypothetical protein
MDIVMKKIIINILVVLPLLMFSVSCNKWLDVKPKTQVNADDMFETYKGFRDALTACYIKMNDRDAYGELLTMSAIESMAQLWEVDENYRPGDYYLMKFDYDNDYAKAEIKRIYAGLYNVIVQANTIIINMDGSGDAISNETTRSVIAGEAYAIRAFCHLDVLRLFGQMPKNASKQVSLPYAETVSINVMPPYYNYEQFIAKIESDLDKAESLLENNDPVFKYSFPDLNYPSTIDLDDTYLAYRQFRFNYWAVKAIKARLYLYTGQTTKAYTAAKEILTAENTDGTPLLTLSGSTDITSGYLTCPSESLIALSNYQLEDYVNSLLGGYDGAQVSSTMLHLTEAKFAELFSGQVTSSHNRYNYVWNRTTVTNQSYIRPTLKKYYQNPDISASNYNQAVPLIRLSEIYLIAMETTTDLAEANSLYADYMASHNVFISTPFESKETLNTEILNEYRREFYAEGQMFFTYKRLGKTSMLWRSDPVTEDNYVVPLPNTEFNPNNL